MRERGREGRGGGGAGGVWNKGREKVIIMFDVDLEFIN